MLYHDTIIVMTLTLHLILRITMTMIHLILASDSRQHGGSNSEDHHDYDSSDSSI